MCCSMRACTICASNSRVMAYQGAAYSSRQSMTDAKAPAKKTATGVSRCPDSSGGLYPSMGSIENTLHPGIRLSSSCVSAHDLWLVAPVSSTGCSMHFSACMPQRTLQTDPCRPQQPRRSPGTRLGRSCLHGCLHRCGAAPSVPCSSRSLVPSIPAQAANSAAAQQAIHYVALTFLRSIHAYRKSAEIATYLQQTPHRRSDEPAVWADSRRCHWALESEAM